MKDCGLGEERMKAELRIRRAEAQHENLFRLAPDYVFVVTTKDGLLSFLRPNDISLFRLRSTRRPCRGGVTKEDSAFDAFAEKEIGCFGEQLFLFAFALDE